MKKSKCIDVAFQAVIKFSINSPCGKNMLSATVKKDHSNVVTLGVAKASKGKETLRGIPASIMVSCKLCSN